MQPTRRDFLLGTGAAVLSGLMGRLPAQSSGGGLDIRPTLLASGFDPDAPDAVLMAVLADVHISLNPATQSRWTDHLNDSLVSELNELQPHLTHLVFGGDVVNSHGPGSGMPRVQAYYEIAREEMRLFKSQLGRFRPDLEVVTVPGNHDTDNQENLEGGVPVLWVEEFGTPPYQKRILAGVAVFFLNSGHAGDLGPAQAQWFAAEAATIPPDQEVLIVAHHPSLYYVNFQTGLKRKVVASFSGHRAPVWVIGGHDHSFGNSLLLHRGTRFIQMETTAGNPRQWGDGNHPGYAVLALQNGHVVCRMYRSLLQPGFFLPLKPVEQMPSQELRWPFDLVEFPAAWFEEGEYNRTGHVVGFLANDLISYFTYLQHIIYQIDLARFGGRVHEFLISAGMAASIIPTMTCSFSEAGQYGPWVDVPFPPPDGRNIYHISIPSQFRSTSRLFVRVSTSMARYAANVTLGGWGLASAGSTLNGYEKWISKTYQTILGNAQTHPDALTTGSSYQNIVNFAFNLPVAAVSSYSSATLPSLSGLPKYSKLPIEVIDFRFARRPAASNPGISYEVQVSQDLENWSPVSESELTVLPLDADWEEVAFALPLIQGGKEFIRVKVSNTTAPGGGFSQWSQQVSVIGGSSGDVNADGIDDLLQFAFGLPDSSEGIRSYDPERVGNEAGLPVQSIRSTEISRLVYPRMRATANPGVLYTVEGSSNLSDWTPLAEEEYSEQILRSDGDWDEVEVVIFDAAHPQRFYRVKLELTTPLAS